MKDFLIPVMLLIVIIEIWVLLYKPNAPLRNYSDSRDAWELRDQWWRDK